MDLQQTPSSEKKVINILPLSKGRRVLLFLADFFINFIVAFLLFIAASFPLGKLFTGYTARNKQYTNDLDNRTEVLIGNKVLFKASDSDLYDTTAHVNFTSDVFLSYYALDEESPVNVKNSQFGHKGENQVFHTYFLNIINDEEKFVSFFDRYNKKNNYFIREGTTITLKAEVKEQVAPNFFKKESVSSLGKKMIKNIKNNVYLPMYSEMMSSINKNDLIYNELSYKKIQSSIKGFETYIYKLVQYSTIITVVLSTGAMYILIPLLNRSHKTIGMTVMKIERVNVRSLGYLKKREVFLSFVYQLFMVFVIAFFIPMTSIGFAEMFKIQLILILGIFSIGMMLLNLVFLLFDRFNRSLFDRLLALVHLPTAELDDVYRAKGYYL